MSESRIAWRRVSRGLTFIGFGVFLFLSTQGLLHRGFWLDALTYWPVLIIALGLRLMFDRTKAPWAVLLSPLVIMGTLTYVAWLGPEPRSSDWRTVQAEGDPQVETWSLEARMALADLDLHAGAMAPGMLLQGRTSPSHRGSVRVSTRGDSSRVYLRDDRWRSGNIRFLPGTRHLWDVDVADDRPMTLRLNAAFVNKVNNVESGVNLGFVNLADGDTEIDIGALNLSGSSTLQLGLINITKKINGLQLGFINVADNGFVKVFPFFNFPKRRSEQP